MRRPEDEEPITEEETAWAEAFWDHLAVGDPYPSRAGLDGWRLDQIEAALMLCWRTGVRRITHQPGRSSRK